MIHEFQVEMTCEGCSGAIRRVLDKYKGMLSTFCIRKSIHFYRLLDKGVQIIDISIPDNRVEVKTTLPANEVLDIIKKTGKKVQHVSSK